MDAPIRYARNGRRFVAYQTFGDGPVDVVLVPAILSHLEANLAFRRYRTFVETVARRARLTVFDKSGQGMSDPASGISTFGERARDVDAVLEASGARRAVVVGNSEGALVAAMYAATRPERVTHLVLAGGFVGPLPRDLVISRVEALMECWGTGRLTVRTFLPSALGNPAEEEAFARLERYTFSPGRVREAYLLNVDLDMTVALDAIRAPTLVMHRRGDKAMPISAGRELAAAIPGARFLELDDGDDHLVWGGDSAAVAEAILDFADAPGAPEPSADRFLAAILFTDIVGSTGMATERGDVEWRRTLDAYDGLAREEARREQGRVVKSTGDGTLALFAAPGQAARTAVAIRERARALGLSVRAAIHVGEVERRGDDVSGLAVHLTARLLEHAGEAILASRTVRDLTAGSALRLEPVGRLALRSFDVPMDAFRVEPLERAPR